MEKTYNELILELALRVRESGEKTPQDKEYDKPDGIEDFTFSFTPTKDEVVALLGRKKKWNLTLLKPFVDILKYKTRSEFTTILPLSSNALFWRMLYKSQQNASRVLQLAQKVGLIECVNESYVWGFGSKCRLYAWNKKTEKILLGLFEEWAITVRQSFVWLHYRWIESVVDSFRTDPEKAKEWKEADRRFNIRICDKTCLPISDNLIMKGLIERYPQLLEMWRTIAEDNEKMPEDERDYAYLHMPRDKNGNVKKISIRKTNAYCSAKKGEGDTASGRMMRDMVLREKFGGVFENDVSGSIYRITYLLNKGVWLDRSVDLYERIYGAKFASKEERDLFKRPLCMYLYFCASGDQAKAKMEFGRPGIKSWNKANEGFALIERARGEMFRAIGRSYRSEIFLHESCIYTQVAHRIRQMGYRLIQVYDGFFTDSPMDEEVFDRIVKEEAERYFRRYCSGRRVA